MALEFISYNNQPVAEVTGEEVVLATVQDSLDLMADADYQGNARSIIINTSQIAPEFFDLKTRIAGDILQKYANYRVKLAIVGSFEQYDSNALNAFIIECNRGGSIFFAGSREEALEKLTS